MHTNSKTAKKVKSAQAKPKPMFTIKVQQEESWLNGSLSSVVLATQCPNRQVRRCPDRNQSRFKSRLRRLNHWPSLSSSLQDFFCTPPELLRATAHPGQLTSTQWPVKNI